ncbi:MAG: hypothetical protein GY906_03105 [bacterium]|nr:hypothetical protein [bacterium]
MNHEGHEEHEEEQLRFFEPQEGSAMAGGRWRGRLCGANGANGYAAGRGDAGKKTEELNHEAHEEHEEDAKRKCLDGQDLASPGGLRLRKATPSQGAVTSGSMNGGVTYRHRLRHPHRHRVLSGFRNTMTITMRMTMRTGPTLLIYL